MSGCVSLVLAALKLTEMKSWSWWRVFLPFWVIVGQNVIYVLVGFLCLFAVRYGEDEEAEEPAKVQSDRIVYQVASLVCVLISTDNLLRWLERGRKLQLVLAVLGKRGNGGFVWDSRPGCTILLLGRHCKEAQRPAS